MANAVRHEHKSKLEEIQNPSEIEKLKVAKKYIKN